MKNNSSRRKFLRNITLGGAAASMSSFSWLENTNITSNLSNEGVINEEAYWSAVRQQFPLSDHRKYFNTGSLGASPKRVIDTVHKWMMKFEFMGEEGHEKIHKVHEKIAKFINCDIDEIAITRNTTEGINIAAQSIPFEAGDEIILTDHAHVGGAAPWLALQKSKGVTIKNIQLDSSGVNNLDLIKESISSKTKAIVLSHVTCTIGMVLPVKEVIEFCKKQDHKIFTCIDGAHPLGMMHLDMKALQPDFYASSGHKWLLGPKGTGIFYINKNVIRDLNPVYAGAHTDSRYDLANSIFEHKYTANRVEYGTRNTPIILGLGEAIDFISEIGILNIEHRGIALAAHLKKGLTKIHNVEIVSPMATEFSSPIVTFRVKNQPYQKIQNAIKYNPKAKSRVRGIHENNINGIRISCGIYNSRIEIDNFLEGLEDIVGNF